MRQTLLKQSHEDLFLDQGWLLALGFREGWTCFRIQHREWGNLEPWSLGAIAAGANLAAFNEVMDANSRHYLEPYKEELIYHTFWGVTPSPARIKFQFPSRIDIGSVLEVPRTLTDNIGYIDGYKSPYRGPFSPLTELFTVKERYPTFQGFNPLSDAMYNVMLSFDQRHYTYEIVQDKDLVKDMLIGNRRVKKYTMGQALPSPMTIPKWLSKLVGDDLLTYTLNVMGGKVK